MWKRIAAVVAGVLVTSTAAAAIDLHQFWDGRCHECHGHAGTFARRHLTVERGVLVGRHHKGDLKRFIALHEAGAAQADALYAMLLAQAQTKPVYQEKCSGCHDNAAAFSRSSLVIREGVISGRSNQLPVARYLERHGSLTAAEIPIVVESLGRALSEVGGAPKAN